MFVCLFIYLSGGFGGPYMYVFSPYSTNPNYRIIKMEK